ncbi:NAD(P)/FAD-dependent oxidoreductase [Streptomyces sp. P38-E01]|uniref:NAD(P)/FAD-dependent oxidoreductase n=1 Tax=Streptomyces tardus TaxID=2780544 RepID=A0A949N4Y8_9ACTN|nr:NAD(P)/FAD-dependent oxidoreductase [Streptomyces tardus]MBU7598414.1 NAD(P)/FAD-dependent oxidoreductase [Streptomyces tardus]
MTDQDRPVHIIGAGPAGLATAAALQRRGVRVLVLDRGESVGGSWRGQYDRLRLDTPRRGSALPGLAIPRSAGRWVARADMVRYLERYAEEHDLEIAAGVEVNSIERAPDEGWVLHANGGRQLPAPAVVVATGLCGVPRVPDWPGRDGYTGELLHSAHYRSPRPYEGKDVLVVGAGASGAETAVDLHRGGAARVRLAVRTPPHILRRSTLGWSAQRTGALVGRLPARLGDGLSAGMARVTVPDLSGRGLRRPEAGLVTRARQGSQPIRDSGLVRAIRRGEVEPVAALESLDGDRVRLADGAELTPDAVIAATGYTHGLAELLGDHEALDADGGPAVGGGTLRAARSVTSAKLPGLYFAGYRHPVSGALREIGRDADRIARALSR